MIYIIIIFIVSILTAFIVLNYSAWEVRSGLRKSERDWKIILPPVRQFEKYLLYSLKHLVQNLVLVVVKYWILFVTKVKKWVAETWPKIRNRIKKTSHKIESEYPKGPSFMKRAIFESKIKIKRMKKQIEQENDMNR